MDFRAFLRAVWADWLALMTTIGSLVFTVIGVGFYDQPVPRWIFFAIAIVCAIAAVIRIWTKEHRMALQREAAISAPEAWREQGERFNQYDITGRSGQIDVCWIWPEGKEDSREWYLNVTDSSEEQALKLVIREAGARLKHSVYIRDNHFHLLERTDDFSRWCEAVIFALETPYRISSSGETSDSRGKYRNKVAADFHVLSRLVCQRIATEEFCVNIGGPLTRS
jgi:hypothetical protein